MSQRLGLAAWVGATVVSVAVSTAAVESVRAQVTERPAVVSLATLRRATSTTVTQPIPAQALSARPASTTTSTTVVETTTTTRASVEATPATTVETTAPPATAAPATEPPRTDDESVTETRTFRGGSVTISFDGDSLKLVEAIPDEGYELTVEQQQAQRIVVRFVDDGRSSGLVAQVTRGGLQIRVFD